MTRSAGAGPAGCLVAGAAEWVDPIAETLDAQLQGNVWRVASEAAALARVEGRAVGCVVAARHLEDGPGLDLVRRVVEMDLPAVLCAASGSEHLASEAIAAGVEDYVPVDDPGEAAERVVEAVRTAGRREERAGQFEALFEDTQTATWVLDPEGRLRRANEAALGSLSGDGDEPVGEPFWRLPWWTDGEGANPDIRHVVESAVANRRPQQLVTEAVPGDGTRMYDLSVHPVSSGGSVRSVVVEGVDVTDRVDLQRELRDSERLHRVTLNNMTDTVLVTDDEGAFTYVCPNVHFIFGYSAAEIASLGTIDELLGEDLFDREELAREGVLTNVECTATDKAGKEHTLLVNVREVDIQGGTRLYSCRDITKRKQREDALAALHGTTRDLLYAETRTEIARTLVADTGDVLDLDASAVYLFESEDTELRPVAASPSFEGLFGALPPVALGEESIVGHTFVENEPALFDDVHAADRLGDPATEMRSGAYIPLGDHGVFVAGSAEVGVFDDVRRELADLVAATTRAALDRVERERRLRRQDRELQQQNAELSRLDEVNELIRGIDRALVQAGTREEITDTVCETLTDSDWFRFAWVGEADPVEDRLEPTARSGDHQGYLDAVDRSVGDSGEPACRTARSQSVTVVRNVAGHLREGRWQSEALAREYQSVLSVPLAYGEFAYGVLTVYADSPDVFDDTLRDVLGELGETVASALSALNRTDALLSRSATRLEFSVRDPGFVLRQVADRAGCQLVFRGGFQRTRGGFSTFATVEGDVQRARAATEEVVSVTDARVLGVEEGGGLLQLQLSGPFVAGPLADHGAVLRRIAVEESSTRLVVDVPGGLDTRPVVAHVGEAFEDAELVAKHATEHTSEEEFYAAFLDRLTDRQLEVVRAAYYSGFFESPREATGEDVAAALDISPPAFYRHARTVQRKLFATLFEDVGISAGPVG